jgi:hypothetical protein
MKVPNNCTEWWTTSDVAAYLREQVGTVTSYREHRLCLSLSSSQE